MMADTKAATCCAQVNKGRLSGVGCSSISDSVALSHFISHQVGEREEWANDIERVKPSSTPTEKKEEKA